MKFITYLKDKLPILLINFFIFLFLVSLLYFYNVKTGIIALTTVIWLIPVISLIMSDFFKKRNYYNTLLSELDYIDKKYLLSEIIDEPLFVEGKILYEVLKTTSKYMHEQVNEYKYAQQEYREYVETWVHEVKTPIASSKLIIENNKNDSTLSILEELIKVEEFVEQVLYYARSSNPEEDYIIKKFYLRPVINEVIMKNSKLFIEKKIHLDIEVLEEALFSDVKWVQFIINQIIVNAVNYACLEAPLIKLYTKERDNSTVLYIEDNGIGIDEKDLPMVFKKGFTGSSGRNYRRSTGMGLYLCKKLCGKLGLGIEIKSIINLGTTVSITFPRSSMIQLESK